MWYRERIIHLRKHKSLKYFNSISPNLTNSTSASAASNSHIEQVSQSKGAAHPRIDVNKYVDSNLTISNVISKPEQSFLSFDDIPGPRSLFLISKFWNSVPKLESQKVIVTFIQNFLSGANYFHNILSWGGNKAFFDKFFHVYGPVVRLHGAFHSDVVLLSRPEHARQIFQQMNVLPIRSCLESIEKYRLDCQKYDQAGLFFTYGTDWTFVRETTSQPSLDGADKKYEKINNISDMFIQRILTKRNKLEEVGDLDGEINRWYLESLFTTTLNTRIGFLDSTIEDKESDVTIFLRSLGSTLEIIEKCEYGFHLWKFVETSPWKLLVKNCHAMDIILNKYLEKAGNSVLEEGSQRSVSYSPFLTEDQKISRSDVIAILMDMVLIGTASTSHTIAFLLYYLSRNIRCQKALQEEVRKFDNNVSKENIEQMKYLNACIKEVLRLNPPVPILSRVLTSDVQIMNYTIPKNTRILFASHLNSHRDDYFEEASKFKPERWLSSESDQYDNFATVPFEYGPKSFVAGEFAKNQIAVLMFKICKRFRVVYDYGDIQSSHKLLASPDKPLKFRFIDNYQ